MTEILLQTGETTEVVQARNTSQTTVTKAKELALAIVDNATLGVAADFLLEIKRRRKMWAEWNKPAKQKLDALKRELLDREQEIDEPMMRAENEILKPAISRFSVEQESKRKEEEDKLRAKQQKRIDDAKIKEAERLEKAGQNDLAMETIKRPDIVPPVIVPRAEAPSGISFREIWKFEIVDANLVPREYLVIDDKKIAGVARALKGETRIPGIRVYSEKMVAGRA